jgi:hypothetical protein
MMQKAIKIFLLGLIPVFPTSKSADLQLISVIGPYSVLSLKAECSVKNHKLFEGLRPEL